MDVAPGITAKALQKTDAEDIAEIKGKIAAQKVSEIEAVQRRKKQIIDEVKKRINANDGPIHITLEMEELGIAKEVWSLVQTAAIAAPFQALCNRAIEDYDDEFGVDLNDSDLYRD
jgi:hypothetical protein